MHSISQFVTAVAVGAAVVSAPSLAFAQSTLTGRLVQGIPGGGAIETASISYYLVQSDGQSVSFQTLIPCSGGSTTNCITASGAFTVTNLQNGTYLLKVFPAGHQVKFLDVVVNGNTDIGDVALIRKPFGIELTIGEIPASGGLIPVTARVTRLWNVPTLPILVNLTSNHETSDGFASPASPEIIPFTWPAALADTGVVPLAPLNVAPSDPAGGYHCVVLQIRLQSNPLVILGGEDVCQPKRP